jgi:hypothetical protein
MSVIPAVDLLNTSDSYACAPTVYSSLGGVCTVTMKSTAYVEPQEDKVFQVKASYGGETINKTFTYYSRRSIGAVQIEKVDNNCLTGKVVLNKTFPALPNYPAYDLSLSAYGMDQSNREVQLASATDNSGFASGQKEKVFTLCGSQQNTFAGRSGQKIRVNVMSYIYQSMVNSEFLVP